MEVTVCYVRVMNCTLICDRSTSGSLLCPICSKLMHLFGLQENAESDKWDIVLVVCCPITDPQTIGADDKVYRTIILHELFVSALKRQNDKHTSVHPPPSTTVPLCGSYGKSNFTHHGLCRLLSISSTQFL